MQVKQIQDYYDQVKERFPEVHPKDIERILKFGWKSLYLHNSYGCDVLIQSRKFWCYFGYLTKDSLKHYSYYIKKLALKFRVLAKRFKIPFDGYYYFGVNDNDYEEYYGKYLTKRRGRPQKWFTFKNIMLYKIFDECRIQGYGETHFFKVKYPDFIGYKLFKETYKISSDRLELIEVRDVPKFKDVLVTNYDYELL